MQGVGCTVFKGGVENDGREIASHIVHTCIVSSVTVHGFNVGRPHGYMA